MAFDKIAISVQEVFKELDQHIERTTSKTGMKCVQFCSACCRKTDIEASAIEFIPLAIWLYKTGKVDEFLLRLDKSDKIGFCALFSPDAQKDGKWGCLNYEKRGLICRLFGFGYRLNREGTPEVVTCKLLKESCPDCVAKARQAGLETPDDVPLFRNYSMQLYSIEPDLARIQLPINQAIRLAIEKLYFQYAPGVEHEEDDELT
jgi:Fe-S-cluster containining protein